jgi:hypothetical protein
MFLGGMACGESEMGGCFKEFWNGSGGEGFWSHGEDKEPGILMGSPGCGKPDTLQMVPGSFVDDLGLPNDPRICEAILKVSCSA